jgi:dihydroorotase
MPNLTIIRPDDWHVHLRDGATLKAVLPYTARVFARAIVMPNLKPPVASTAQTKAYRDEIIKALPKGSDFTPLMTVYLTDETDSDDLAKGHAEKIITAAKLYPANATTNSEAGVTDLKKLKKVFERMQRIGMPLLVHGEATDPDIDVFDREAVFIEKTLQPLRRAFPELKIVLEHVTTIEGIDYVKAEGKKGFLAATITAHHLVINRNAIFQGGLHPHYYCLPVAKREKHRLALVKAATSGAKMFFLGTDTAPHSKTSKESACGCAGIFSAPNALNVYAQVFDDAGRLPALESFASKNGPAFYGLPVNKSMIKLEKKAKTAADIKPILTEKGETLVAFTSPTETSWQIA